MNPTLHALRSFVVVMAVGAAACDEPPLDSGRPCRTADSSDCPADHRCLATAAGAICVPEDDLPAADFDRDGVLDDDDACLQSVLSFLSTPDVDLDGDGCHDGREDQDDDGDGRGDDVDACPQSDLSNGSFVSDATTDHDGDGCEDELQGEDVDDDNDSILDQADACPRGELAWVPSVQLDHDEDGCLDATEDQDDDNDGVGDIDDLCPQGEAFVSTPETDHDADGCRDQEEDSDDDNDGLINTVDRCPLSPQVLSGPFFDFDGDGCDASEDDDDDGDNVPDADDRCEFSTLLASDHDDDGCDDAVDDSDDDDDGVQDILDDCPRGLIGPHFADNDGDGCSDVGEDVDDDNDSVSDLADDCLTSPLGFVSRPDTDVDADGCYDDVEDEDDDNDSFADDLDLCPRGFPGVVNPLFDHDRDGCRDAFEDDDDDNDAVSDSADRCPVGVLFVSSPATDFDGDGCQDGTEDLDDDDDGIDNGGDNCDGPGRDSDGDAVCDGDDVCPGRDDARCDALPFRGAPSGGTLAGVFACPAGLAAVGVDYGVVNSFAGLTVSRLNVACRAVSGTSLTGGVSLSPTFTVGSAPTANHVVRCDTVQPDGILVGQKIVSTSGGFQQVFHLGALCRRLSNGATYEVQPPSVAGGVVSNDTCPSGQDVWGFQPRAGQLFDALSFRCGARLP